MAHDAFISHAHEDKTIADMVCARLEQNGIRCWIAPRDIQPGDDWADAILKAIQSSRVVVLVYSDAANRSPHVPREIDRAIGHQVPIVPFRIDSAPLRGRLEYSLSSLHWLDAITPPVEQHIKRLSESIQSLLGTPEITAASNDATAPSLVKPPSRRRSFGSVLKAAIVITGIVVLLLVFKPWQGHVTPPQTANGPQTTAMPSAITAGSGIAPASSTTSVVPSATPTPSTTAKIDANTITSTQDSTKGLCGVALPAGATRTLHRQGYEEYSVAMSRAEIESFFRDALRKDHWTSHPTSHGTSALGTLGGLLPKSSGPSESEYSKPGCILSVTTPDSGRQFSLSATQYK